MCYSRDYKLLADQQKRDDAQLRRERQAGVLDTMLTDANKKPEGQGSDADQRRRAGKISAPVEALSGRRSCGLCAPR